MKIGKILIFVMFTLFLVGLLIYPAVISTRTYAWFNYMGDNIKEVVDLMLRYETLRTGGPYGYKLAYNIDREETVVEDLDLKFSKIGAQFKGEYYISGAARKEGIEGIAGWLIFLYAIFLSLSAVLIYRGRKLNYPNAINFHDVPKDKFEMWREYMNKSINSFFWATWGTFISSIGIGIFISPFFIHPRSPGIFLFVFFLAIVSWFILGLFDSLRYKARVVELKKLSGIVMEKNVGKPKLSSLAIAGLICSIVGLIWWIIPTFIGFTLGIAVLKTINRSHGEIRGKGMAMAAIIICTLNTIVSIFLIVLASFT